MKMVAVDEAAPVAKEVLAPEAMEVEKVAATAVLAVLVDVTVLAARVAKEVLEAVVMEVEKVERRRRER